MELGTVSTRKKKMDETARINRCSGREHDGQVPQGVKSIELSRIKIFIIGFPLVVLTSYEIMNPVAGR